MRLIGQASAILAWMSLRDAVPPRHIVTAMLKVREVQQRLWPWQDVARDDLHFEAAILRTTRRIWLPDADSVFFQSAKIVTRGELAGLLARLHHATPKAKGWPALAETRFTDVPADSAQRAGIEAMLAWGNFGEQQVTFTPESPTTWGTLHRWLTALDLPANAGLAAGDRKNLPLTRAECVQHL